MRAVAPVDALKSFCCRRAEPYRSERAFHHIRRPWMLPVGFGEVVERDHAVPVILEHRHSFRVLRPITLAERLTSFERRGPCRGVDDCAQQFLGL